LQISSKNLHQTGKQQNVIFSSGSILGHLLFILHINDLPHGINIYSKPALFSDDTSVSMTANNLNDLQIRSTSVVNYMSTVTGLSLNIYKGNVIKLNLKHLHDDSCQILDQDTENK
jgi:hypothetical protein